MVIDSSAIIAILRSEDAASTLLTHIKTAGALRASTATVLEAAIVMFARYGDAGEREVDNFLHRLRVDVIPFTREQLDVARSAYRRFGKGRHPAALNYGDCFSYALSISLQEPLLFTGSDFTQTDVVVASE